MCFMSGAKLSEIMKWGDPSEPIFHVELRLSFHGAHAQNDMCCQLREHWFTDCGSYIF